MAKATNNTANYILMPTSGLLSIDDAPEVSDFFSTLSAHTMSATPLSLNRRGSKAQSNKIKMKVLDSIHENGAKLVQLNEENLAEVRLSYPGVRIIPEVKYEPAWAPQLHILQTPSSRGSRGGSKNISFEVFDSLGGAVGGARVVLLTDFINRVGFEGTTNSQGKVSIGIAASQTVERLYVYPKHSCWPLRVMKPKLNSSPFKIIVSSIDLSFVDSFKLIYQPHSFNTLPDAVTVAVVDTGVGPHSDVPLAGGMNLVRNQPPQNFTDVAGHGTHVAGIIGASNQPPSGMRGIAAGVKLMSYRVFAGPRSGASNFDIMKAVDQAVLDGCDLVNLSLGGTQQDPGVSLAIAAAYQRGVVCFAATGNSNRAPVSFPAAAQFSVAVSAMGRKNTWPKNSAQADMVKAPLSAKDPGNFIASFSNVGAEVDMTAPGVGIISTFPNNLYAVMDGTSMACPAATGAAARLLAGDQALLTADRNSSRANGMIKLFSTFTKTMGFKPQFEGKGLLKP